MATNGKPGKSRKGMVKNRSQFLNPLIDRFVKRDTRTGKIVGVKADRKTFKGVRRER